MYVPSWSQKIITQLFPNRYLTKRFRGETHLHVGDGLNGAVAYQFAEPADVGNLNQPPPVEYPAMPNPYESLPSEHDLDVPGIISSHSAPVFGAGAHVEPIWEASPFLGNAREITDAIDGIKALEILPAPGLPGAIPDTLSPNGLDGLLHDPLESPTGLEQMVDDPMMDDLFPPIFGPL
ncbi:MAG: hypothetical protein HY644_02445 [Acidobacteria bacterium]|nr:hypothetical protein [Acidobacteriota bacterium]